MSKNSDTLSHIGGLYILYKLKWVIIIGIIFIVIVCLIMFNDINKEYKEYGYTSILDNVKYDNWTGEIIPKDKTSTYKSDYKTIITPDGSNISVRELEYYIESYNSIQGNYRFLTEKRKEQTESLINMMFTLMFKINCSFEKDATDTKYTIHLKNFDANGVHYDDYEIGPTSELRNILKLLFKGIYREQNSLKPDYGY